MATTHDAPTIRRTATRIHLAPGERWCRRCGSNDPFSHQDGDCNGDDNHDWVPAAQVLRPEEIA